MKSNLIKKNTYFVSIIIIILLVILIANCTVNGSTSKITIVNKSNVTVSNIKIGNTVVCSFIAPGATVDYYFVIELTGQYSGNGVISAGYTTSYDNNKNSVVRRTGVYTLKSSGYFFDSEIFQVGKNYYMTLRCEKNGYDYSQGSDEYTNGGYYKD